MSNISGDATGWIDVKVSESDVKTDKIIFNYAGEIEKLVSLHNEIQEKYKVSHVKDVGDALIHLEMTIKSLKN